LLTCGEFGLEFREVGSAVLHDDHFSVDDRLTGISSAPAMRENRFVQSNPLRV
jgi:hypothetical protein